MFSGSNASKIFLCEKLSFWLIIINFKLFLAVLGLGCCAASFRSSWPAGVLYAESGLLIAVAALGMEHGLCSTGSVAVAHRLSCSEACGIFLEQGLNLCPLHWQADS